MRLKVFASTYPGIAPTRFPEDSRNQEVGVPVMLVKLLQSSVDLSRSTRR